MITKEELEKRTKEQLVELCLLLADTADDKVQALTGYKRQVKAMITFMNEHDIVSVASMTDKDDKTWDRGKYIMENLNILIGKLDAMEERMLPVLTDQKIVQKAKGRRGAITSYIDGPPPTD